jgi:ABC-type ATPase involved in cell division
MVASHDLSLIAKMHHRILTLKDGALITDGLGTKNSFGEDDVE